MARVARSQQMSSIVSITQKTTVECFRDAQDRDKFLDILKKTQHTFNYECYAFCLLNDHEFRIIIDTKGRSISKIMQSITIAYAIYRQSESKLFTQRFKSKALFTKEAILDEISVINQKTPTKYNSYCIYQQQLSSELSFMSRLLPHHFQVMTTPQKTMSDEEVMRETVKFLEEKSCSLEELKKNKHQRNLCILELRQKIPCSLKQLGMAMGGLSESSVSKIIKQMEHND